MGIVILAGPWNWIIFGQCCRFYDILMTLDGLAGQAGVVFLWCKFLVLFRWMNLKIWTSGVCIRMCHQAYHTKIFGQEKPCDLNWELVANNVHDLEFCLLCTWRSKSNFAKKMVLNVTFHTCLESFIACSASVWQNTCGDNHFDVEIRLVICARNFYFLSKSIKVWPVAQLIAKLFLFLVWQDCCWLGVVKRDVKSISCTQLWRCIFKICKWATWMSDRNKQFKSLRSHGPCVLTGKSLTKMVHKR